ncbi:hypothetical protein F2Q68_00003646 [Brassica cretica]|uniref:Reticuline oxidase-like protein n=1 Tax=Brassica cretica TaxID=69181 RepID=A0A8S9J7B1_BRACR|nr:hypothetical protein F2Q68_00003646 [Brassica cretica]
MKLLCLTFVFLVSTTLTTATPPPDATIYQNFLQCFTTQTRAPPNTLTDVVFPQPQPVSTPTYATTSETRVSTPPRLPKTRDRDRRAFRCTRPSSRSLHQNAQVPAENSERRPRLRRRLVHLEPPLLPPRHVELPRHHRRGRNRLDRSRHHARRSLLQDMGKNQNARLPRGCLSHRGRRRITLVPVPETVTVFRAQKNLDENAVEMVHKWQFVAPKTDHGLFMRVLLQPVTRNKVETVRASVLALFLGKSSEVLSLLNKDVPELGLKQENCTELTWIQSVLWWDNHDNATLVKPEVLLERNLDTASYGKKKSDFVEKEITKEGLDYLMRKMIEVGKIGLVFNPYGKKVSEVATTKTPFPHRMKLYKVQHSMNWKDPGTEAETSFLEKAKSFYSYMAPFVTKNPRHTYLNYRDLDIGVNTHGPNSYREGEVYGREYF